MRVTLLQQDVVWGSPRDNRRAAEEAMCGDGGAGTRLFVLPEMFSTGFVTRPEDVAERDGESLGWMQEMADRTGAAIASSVAVAEDGHYYNRLYFITPSTCEESRGGVYDKHHLFTYGGEHLHYTPGDRRVTVEWGGVRFLLQVCYDLRFPVWSRYRGDYDAIIYVASWPESRREVWDTLLRARAIENQCYVLGVNRVGSDPACRYNGGTAAIDPYGRVMAQCSDGEASSVSIDLDMERLRAFRQKFPVLEDRDVIHLL